MRVANSNKTDYPLFLTIGSAMTTAPMTAELAQTANAVGIGSSAWLERPVQNINKIKAFVALKINEEISCVALRMMYSDGR